MLKISKLTYLLIAITSFSILPSCGKSKSRQDIAQEPDTLAVEVDSVAEVPEDTLVKIDNYDDAVNFMENSDESAEYMSGIMPVIAKEVPEYAEKLLNSEYDSFIVVDKASMRVILYDRFGRTLKSYDMACAKNYGTKHKKADSRTPEGFFSVEGIYNSTDWLFTDDDGRTSKKKGQFGPRFIRLRIPGTTQIGIHGTCAPWSVGHRVSHGCIRITNEQILELVELVTPGMPVIVLPGRRDREVNREEGVEIAYFPTAPKYAMSAKERNIDSVKKNLDEIEKNGDEAAKDSLMEVTPVEVAEPDSGQSSEQEISEGDSTRVTEQL